MMYKLHYNAANVSNSGILRSNICQNFSYASAVAIWKYEWYDFIARYFHEFFGRISRTHLDMSLMRKKNRKKYRDSPFYTDSVYTDSLYMIS